jgi:two-component system, response regulator YesN
MKRMHRVLLVDDETYTRKGIRNLVDWQSCGFEVVNEADNGEDALSMIESIKPDLVITDIRMPVLDGLELIRRTKENKLLVQPFFIIISGYDDFKYAQQAVRYGVQDFILKPIEAEVIEAALRQLNDKLFAERRRAREQEQVRGEMMITSLIQGDIDEQMLPEYSRLLNLRGENHLRYVFIELNDVHPWREVEYPFDQERIKLGIIQTLREEFAQDSFLYEHRNRYGLIWIERESAQFSSGKQHTSDFPSLQEKLTTLLETPVFIYLGKQVDSLRDLSESYRTAKNATLYKFIKNDSRLVVYEHIEFIPLSFIDLDQSWYHRFIEQIEEQGTQPVMSSIDVLFKNFQANHLAPEAIKLAIHQCVSGILKIMKQMEFQSDELHTLDAIVSWQDMNLSLDELKRLFSAFIMESMDRLSKHRKESIKGGIQKIKSYIETNYADNISLKGIASHFYMNPVYLGQLFKKTYGVFFNEFLLQIRVNEAKKLLRQTDLRIYEIAERVGFSNSDYFVTQFEKTQHMTPTEYRNTLM